MIRDRKHRASTRFQMLNPVLLFPPFFFFFFFFPPILMRVASQMDLAKGLRYTADKSQSLRRNSP